MKYIHFKLRGFVLFEETQDHAQMAAMIGDEVESAGFARACEWCDGGQVVCTGQSMTLKKSAHEDDTERLRRRLALV